MRNKITVLRGKSQSQNDTPRCPSALLLAWGFVLGCYISTFLRPEPEVQLSRLALVDCLIAVCLFQPRWARVSSVRRECSSTNNKPDKLVEPGAHRDGGGALFIVVGAALLSPCLPMYRGRRHRRRRRKCCSRTWNKSINDHDENIPLLEARY